MPEPESVHVKCTATGPWCHPFAFGAGVSAATIAGAVWSILMAPLRKVPTRPATSAAWPVAERLLPSVASVMGAVRVPGAMPDSASVAEKVTVTGPLFQPLTFGGGAAAAVTTGLVLSTLRVTLALAVFPDLSVAVPETTCPAPSVLTTTGAGQVSMPAALSEQVNFTVTLPLFQPLELGMGVPLA